MTSDSVEIRSALPSWWARAVAFLAILLGGLCGGLIGFAVVDLQCTGDCTNWNGLGMLVGAAAAAGGVAIVAVLALRAMDEWHAGTRSGDPGARPSDTVS